MANTILAAQLYTIRDYLKTPADIATSMKKIKEIGYDAVQVSGMGPIDPVEYKKIADDLDLQICATHISFDKMVDETDAVMKEHKLWDCKYIGAGSLPASYRQSGKAGYVKFAKDASKIGKIFRENGFKFIYHNHAFEFEKAEGQTFMETLFNESTPEDFEFEIDTYWVQTGGSDPAAWIKKCSGRIHVVHLKDMVINNENKQIMAEIGEGNLNWPSIISECKAAGVEWYVVEQDTCQRNPFDSLKISLDNLKSWGLK